MQRDRKNSRSIGCLRDFIVREVFELTQYILSPSRGVYGDANFDGAFDSTDLVAMRTSGEYEDGIPGNSMWSEGAWDADGDFESGDSVIALQDGGYVRASDDDNRGRAGTFCSGDADLGLNGGFLSRTRRAKNA